MAAAQPEAWELSKENYVPVKSGRKKAALAETADPADSSSKQALEAKRKELWREIREYKGGDPIEPWQKWVPRRPVLAAACPILPFCHAQQAIC